MRLLGSTLLSPSLPSVFIFDHRKRLFHSIQCQDSTIQRLNEIEERERERERELLRRKVGQQHIQHQTVSGEEENQGEEKERCGGGGEKETIGKHKNL